MSILLDQPGVPARRLRRCSATARASSPARSSPSSPIALVNLMHFSQGWVQFGYRFSNDFVVFALPLVAVGMQRRGGVGLLGFVADRRRRSRSTCGA